MTSLVIRADARRLPLPDDSVDLIVTSPPYFSLRSYTDDGAHFDGQVGDEPHPRDYVAALLEVTGECMRVLKPRGSMFVNLGDKYAERAGPGRYPSDQDDQRFRKAQRPQRRNFADIRAKSLMGLPWRYAIGCTDELGLILREEVIWSKANGMPEAVTDRLVRRHEQWFHLVQSPRYFAALDLIREPYVDDRNLSRRIKNDGEGKRAQRVSWAGENPLGKIPESVWRVASEPLSGVPDGMPEHHAAFPPEWPLRLISGWSPTGICTACGEGRRPRVERPGLLGGDNNPHSRDGSRARSAIDGGRREWARRMEQPDYVSGEICGCGEFGLGDPAPVCRPAVILDPFGGTGTTALAATVLGRIGISVDLSHDYGRLAAWRTTDPRQRALAQRRPPPPPVNDDQGALW